MGNSDCARVLRGVSFCFFFIPRNITTMHACMGKDGFCSLFKEANPLFRKRNWYLIIIFFLLIFGTLIMYLIPSVTEATLALVLLAIPIAVIHGVGEETLWRGLCERPFPQNAFLGMIYPIIGFALWHLSPQIIFPAETGIFIFLVSTFFLGISYALIAYKTSSIKWVALLHAIGSLLALGQPITTSIIAILGF